LSKKKQKQKQKNYSFVQYVTSTLGMLSLGTTPSLLNFKEYTKIGKILNLHKSALFSYCVLQGVNVSSYKQLLFMIASNTKQYFLSFIGYNINFFKTVSTGKLLSKQGISTKALKSSKKSDKHILNFFNDLNSEKVYRINYFLLRPVNRKNFDMYYLILKTYKVDLEFIGFKHYYKVTVKTIRRIKKRIKKRIIRNHVHYN
jgi:hypothetical protein